MSKHPHFYKDRFYNSENDSIRLRLWHSTKVFFKSIPKQVAKSVVLEKNISDLDTWKVVSENNFHKYVKKCSVTWIGHSTFLIQIAGFNILTDPVFFNVSRFFPRNVSASHPLQNIPKVDFVLLSHNHRDHLEIKSLKILFHRDNPVYLIPFGDERLFTRMNSGNVFQSYWWNEYEFNNNSNSKIKFTFLPAVHWSGRDPFDINKSLWGSWMIEGSDFKIYFAGDSAFGKHFEKIGQQFCNIDLALMPISPCQPRELMAESHLDPDEAIQAFLYLRAKSFVPMHWGTFKSCFESALTPIHELQQLWSTKEADLLKDKFLNILKFGQTVFFD